MAITIYRASDLYNTPARPATPERPGKPAKRGIFNVGRSQFYEEIEPDLERVKLGERAIGYTGRSVDKKIEISIAESTPRRSIQRREAVS
jgi:hypothetical protein